MATQSIVTAKWVIDELAKIGRASIGDVMQWGHRKVIDAETGAETIEPFVCLTDSAKLPPEVLAGISEITVTSAGLRVKMHGKMPALVRLGEHVGAFLPALGEVGRNARRAVGTGDGSGTAAPLTAIFSLPDNGRG